MVRSIETINNKEYKMPDIKITSKLNIPKAFWILLGIAFVLIAIRVLLMGEARVIVKENKKGRHTKTVEQSKIITGNKK